MTDILVAAIQSAPICLLIYVGWRLIGNTRITIGGIDRLVDELVDVRAAHVNFVKALTALVSRVGPSEEDKPRTPAPSIPQNILDWINRESEPWAVSAYVRRAQNLYHEYEGAPDARWTQVFLMLQKEEGEIA